MSNAKKCDRCGKLYEDYVGIQLNENGNYFCTFSISGCGKSKHYDLCEDCMRSLINWIKADKEKK